MHQLTLAFTALVRDEAIAELQQSPSRRVIRIALKLLAKRFKTL
jgi:hypothetical protein